MRCEKISSDARKQLIRGRGSAGKEEDDLWRELKVRSLLRMPLSEIPLTLHNRQRAVRLDTRWLRRFARHILPACLAESGDGRFALREVGEIAVAIVSDRAIAAVHQQFMQIPGATDV